MRTVDNQLTVRQLIFLLISSFIVLDGHAVELQTQAKNESALFKDDWLCQKCFYPEGWELDFESGLAYLGGEPYYFGHYTGLDEKGAHLLADLSAEYWRKDATFFSFQGKNLGLESRQFEMTGGRQGIFQADVFYTAIPVRQGNQGETPYLGAGSDTLTLASDWVAASTTQDMTQLRTSLNQVTLDRTWKKLGMALSVNPWENWQLDLQYSQIDEQGKSQTAGSSFFNTAGLIKPINGKTEQAVLMALYRSDAWKLRVSYLVSDYVNRYESLSWQNAYLSTSGQLQGQQALSPDNESHSLDLTASWQWLVHTRINGEVRFGQMTQNQPLLTQSLAASQNSYLSSNAKVETFNAKLKLSSRILQPLNLEWVIDFDERDNQTPEREWLQFENQFSSPFYQSNFAYDYQRKQLAMQGEYYTSNGWQLLAGIDTERFSRSHQERRTTQTNDLWFQTRTQLNEWAGIDFRLNSESRNGSDYQALRDEKGVQNSLMRKYHLADRDQLAARFQSMFYINQHIDLLLEFEHSEEDYNASLVGLAQVEYQRMGADLSYIFSDSSSTYASYSQESYRSIQNGSQHFADADWTGTARDRYDVIALGIKIPDWLERFNLQLEFQVADSKSRTQNDTGGLFVEFPLLKSRWEQVKLELEYPHNDSWFFTVEYRFENFDSNDWALDNVEVDTMPQMIAMANEPRHYRINGLYLTARYLITAESSD